LILSKKNCFKTLLVDVTVVFYSSVLSPSVFSRSIFLEAIISEGLMLAKRAFVWSIREVIGRTGFRMREEVREFALDCIVDFVC
jgi:hypothetical protein